MSLPTTLQAYRDCEEVFDRALASGAGVRVRRTSYEHCYNYRSRMHMFRKLARAKNADIYPSKDHPMHGRSPYDHFTCRIKEDGGQWFIYVEPNTIENDFIEPLDKVVDDEAMPLMVPSEPPKALPPPKEEIVDDIQSEEVVPLPTLTRRF